MTEGAPRVVVIDDDPAVRRGLERLLRSAGYRVETFESARRFRDEGDLDATACLVVDVTMPEEGGLELQEALSSGGYEIPVVFITGHGDDALVARAVKGGAVDVLAKPFDASALMAAVARGCARRGPRRPPTLPG